VDIAVIGGGPAGLAFAIDAQLLGFNVTVIDSRRAVAPVGEVLGSVAKYSLLRLGIYDEFQRDHRPILGRRVRWGSDDLRESNALFSPFGSDWLVDRSAFEGRLRSRARLVGVQLCRDHAVDVRSESGAWAVMLRSGNQVRCGFLVDASGRAMWVARRLGSRPVTIDRLIGVSFYGGPLHSDSLFDVESAPEGWWYRAPLSDETDILMLMTDSDLIPPDLEKAARRTRIAGGVDFWRRSVRPAHTAYSEIRFEEGWAPVGDAALATDPLSGRGLIWALESAHLLARALKGWSDVNNAAVRAYVEAWSDSIQKHLATRSFVYGSESRWHAFTFWQRRHWPALD